MRVHPGAGAIYWAVTLTAVGMLLLVQGLGHGLPIWGYVVRGWPVLLIGWGALKIVDYRRLRHADGSRALFSRSEIAVLLFVVFGGSALTTAVMVKQSKTDKVVMKRLGVIIISPLAQVVSFHVRSRRSGSAAAHRGKPLAFRE